MIVEYQIQISNIYSFNNYEGIEAEESSTQPKVVKIAETGKIKSPLYFPLERQNQVRSDEALICTNTWQF